MKKTKILYINDYACDNQAVRNVYDRKYPKFHLWGVTELLGKKEGFNISFCNPNNFGFGYVKNKNCISLFFNRIVHLIKWILIFIKYFNSNIIYSALPGYEIGFLLMKKLRLKQYRIITVVHHPGSRIVMRESYDRLIFISKVAYKKYSDYSNCEFLFWGPDLDFYKSIDTKQNKKEYDFIAAGKTLRDYDTLRKSLKGMHVKTKIIGANNSKTNEITYIELLRLYNVSRFIVIPMAKQNNPNHYLIGLTSFLDVMGMGLPVIMSDNSNIGIDIDKIGIGFTYPPGDSLALHKILMNCSQMDSSTYEEMCNNCRKFAQENSFEKFSNHIKSILLA